MFARLPDKINRTIIPKLQALVYDMLSPWRQVPECDAERADRPQCTNPLEWGSTAVHQSTGVGIDCSAPIHWSGDRLQCTNPLEWGSTPVYQSIGVGIDCSAPIHWSGDRLQCTNPLEWGSTPVYQSIGVGIDCSAPIHWSGDRLQCTNPLEWGSTPVYQSTGVRINPSAPILYLQFLFLLLTTTANCALTHNLQRWELLATEARGLWQLVRILYNWNSNSKNPFHLQTYINFYFMTS